MYESSQVALQMGGGGLGSKVWLLPRPPVVQETHAAPPTPPDPSVPLLDQRGRGGGARLEAAGGAAQKQ